MALGVILSRNLNDAQPEVLRLRGVRSEIPMAGPPWGAQEGDMWVLSAEEPDHPEAHEWKISQT